MHWRKSSPGVDPGRDFPCVGHRHRRFGGPMVPVSHLSAPCRCIREGFIARHSGLPHMQPKSRNRRAELDLHHTTRHRRVPVRRRPRLHCADCRRRADRGVAARSTSRAIPAAVAGRDDGRVPDCALAGPRCGIPVDPGRAPRHGVALYRPGCAGMDLPQSAELGSQSARTRRAVNARSRPAANARWRGTRGRRRRTPADCPA